MKRTPPNALVLVTTTRVRAGKSHYHPNGATSMNVGDVRAFLDAVIAAGGTESTRVDVSVVERTVTCEIPR